LFVCLFDLWWVGCDDRLKGESIFFGQGTSNRFLWGECFMAKGGVQQQQMGIGGYVRMGVGLGAGFAIVNIVLLVIGLAFLIPGAIMASKELKKEKGERDNTKLYAGIALCVVGAVLTLGAGLPFVLGLITQM
jgi:hypothetical protein